MSGQILIDCILKRKNELSTLINGTPLTEKLWALCAPCTADQDKSLKDGD